MSLPTFSVIDDAHRLRLFFEQKFFGDPWGLKTIDQALAETRDFFDDARLQPAQDFLTLIVDKSVNELGLKFDTTPTPDLFYRIHENFILFEVSVQKSCLCTFDDRTVRATCVLMYTNGDRIKLNPERAALWGQQKDTVDLLGQHQFSDAMLRLREGDVEGCMDLLVPLAKQGQVKAQYNLGVIYRDGLNGRVDLERAVEYFGRACQQGDLNACNCLGLRYRNGEGVSEDQKKAFDLFQRCATAGHLDAKLNLAIQYGNGWGCKKDIPMFKRLLEEAADGGQANAQWILKHTPAALLDNGLIDLLQERRVDSKEK